MTEVLTESFCERCGTKYTFEGGAEAPSPVRRARTLVRGLRYYLLSDDPLDEALAEARRDDERDSAGRQLDAFHQTFNFCIECRQYVCGECWNEQASRCLTCAPMPGRVDVLGLEVDLSARLGPAAAAPEAAGVVGETEAAQGGAWPTADLVAAPQGSREATKKVAAEASAAETIPAEAIQTEAAASPVETIPAAAVQAEAAASPATPSEAVQAETSSVEAVAAQATQAETAPVEMVQAAATPVETTATEAGRATEDTAAEPATSAEAVGIEAAAPAAPPRAPAEKAGAAATPTPPVAEAAAAATPTPPAENAAAPAPAPTTAPAPSAPVWQIVAPEEAAPAAGESAAGIPRASGQQLPESSSLPRPRRGGGIFRRRVPAAPSQSTETPHTRPTAPSAGRTRQPAVPPPAWIRAQSAGEQAAAGNGLWEDSARGVLSHPESSVQACVSCGLPLSATARFCRRCGAKQG